MTGDAVIRSGTNRISQCFLGDNQIPIAIHGRYCFGSIQDDHGSIIRTGAIGNGVAELFRELGQEFIVTGCATHCTEGHIGTFRSAASRIDEGRNGF